LGRQLILVTIRPRTFKVREGPGKPVRVPSIIVEGTYSSYRWPNRPFSSKKTPKWKFDFAELEMEHKFRKFYAILAVKV
jgi:hypothetical protein